MRRLAQYICFFGGSIFIMLSGNSFAQSPPNLPAASDVSRFEERFLIPDHKQRSDVIERDVKTSPTDIPKAENGFILNKIIFEGITIDIQSDIDQITGEYIGREVDLNVLNHLTNRITNLYRQNGYFLSTAVIPAQEVVDGTITIHIIEGRVGEVRIEDPENFLKNDHLDIVQKTIKIIETLNPLHGPTLEKYILLLNDHTSVSIHNILAAPKNSTEPGTVDIILKVYEKIQNNYFLSYDNFGSRFVGPHQLTGSYSKNNILTIFDQLVLQGSTSIPANEVKFLSLSYKTPLTSNGLELSTSASYSESEPGFSLQGLEVKGKSATFSASLNYPIIRSRRENLSIGTSFSLQNSATQFLQEELIDDKTRSISLNLDYDTYDRWDGINTLILSVTHGLNILDAKETGSDNLSREEGRSDFFKTELNFERQQNIGSSLNLTTAVNVQKSNHPLLSSEEFGYGGTSFGRAYDPSEITGDSGASASVEVLYTRLPTIESMDLKLTPFIFYDIGKVWNNDRDTDPISASSTGIGTYYNLPNNISGSLQLAYPLTKQVSTPVMNGSSGPRILFNMSTSF